MAERDTSPPDETATPGADEPQPWGAGADPPLARWRRRALWGGGAVCVLAALAFAWPAVESVLPRAATGLFGGGAEEAPSALEARVAALETAIARLDGRIAAAAGTAGAALPRPDAARLADRIAALETRPAPPPDRRIAPLAARIDGLARRLDALERAAAGASGAAPVGAPPADAALETMAARIARLEAALDPGLAQKLDSAGARVDGIEAELRRLAAAGGTRKGDALLLAIGQLRAAAAGPRPFDAELRLVLKAAGGDAAIEAAAKPLSAHAPRGIPARAALEARFPALAARAAQEALAPEDGDWLDRTAARVSRVVTLRRVGEGVGEGPLAAIARAEGRLAAGDLAAAAAALDGLDGAPARVFGDWRAAASARAAADAAIAGLSRLAVERFAAAGGGG